MADLVMFPHCDLHMALHGVGSGGTPDLFYPEGGWEQWDIEARAALAARKGE